MKNHRHTLRTLALAALTFSAAGAAQADLNFYTSQSAFLAATSATQVDTFDDLFWAEGPNYLYRTAGPYSYYGYSLMPDASYSSFYNAGTDADVWLSTNQATDIISLQFYDGIVFGVGGYFFATDANGSFMPGQSIKLDALDADGNELVQIVDNAMPNTFYGFASSSPITYFEISAVQPNGDYAWATANNLTLGGVAAVVPEPASYALLMAGLGVVALGARRRRLER
ncbi:MAG TPA: PEP-CTERM sorting domain-containing protein [Burkholderiaceae bacterium]